MTTSRRSILSALGALPLASVPVLAAVTTAAPDPAYAAIERHRIAAKAYYAGLAKTGHLVDVPEDLDREGTILCEVETEARINLHQAVPTTLAGLKAYVDHWRSYIEAEPLLDQDLGWDAVPTIAEALKRMCAADLTTI